MTSIPCVSDHASLPELRVLITGASRGLGKGLCQSLLSAGATVMALARSAQDLAQLKEEHENQTQAPGRLLVHAGSMLDTRSLETALHTMEQATGGLDLLIANAGVYGPYGTFQDVNAAEWEEALLINSLGLSRSCRSCIPALAKSGRGQIIVIGSALGHQHGQNCSAYCSSKAMSWSLVKCLSSDLAPLGIAVNELIPGPVNTAMNPGASSQAACREPDDPAFLQLISYLWHLPGSKPSGQSFSLRSAP